MRVIPLPGPFGVSVGGIDLSSDMSDATMRALIGLLHEHQILAITGQHLTNAAYVKFGYFWGKPLNFALKGHTRDDFPEMIRIANSASTPERYRDGAMHWHSDSTYESVPAAVTMLYGVESPETGGDTMLASTAMAYDALSETMKQRIDGLVGLHCLGGSPELPGEKIPFFPEETARHGISKHPLIVRHPVTGRKAIFTSGTAFGAEGLERDEGLALIAKLRAHITQSRFVSRYKVMKGDIFLWDNYQTLHSATPIEYSDEPAKRRLLYRISTKGVPDLCRSAQAA
ncbi:MAG TPA: TauD/TfdA family dioxygenase [Acetobacteraceae bacterium]|nr:TauD/TfdA family dioxygenase [Acetobacteraceae bacterium]